MTASERAIGPVYSVGFSILGDYRIGLGTDGRTATEEEVRAACVALGWRYEVDEDREAGIYLAGVTQEVDEEIEKNGFFEIDVPLENIGTVNVIIEMP